MDMQDRGLNIASAAPQFNRRRQMHYDHRDDLTESFMSTGINNSIIKSNLFQPDLPSLDDSVFKNKRNTVNLVTEVMPGLINQKDPLHMNSISR